MRLGVFGLSVVSVWTLGTHKDSVRFTFLTPQCATGTTPHHSASGMWQVPGVWGWGRGRGGEGRGHV